MLMYYALMNFLKSCKCRASTLFQKFKFKTDNKATYYNEVKLESLHEVFFMKLYIILTIFSMHFKLPMLDRFEAERIRIFRENPYEQKFKCSFKLALNSLCKH